MTFGLQCDQPRSNAIMDKAADAGVSFIDTADVYPAWVPGNHGGESETAIGQWLQQSGKRGRVLLASKVGKWDRHAGLRPMNIRAALEGTLRRLRTDHVDLYWMHFEDPHTPLEETLRALDDLVHAGKVRYLGVSDTPAWKVAAGQVEARFRGWSPFVALQIEYSLAERTVEHDLLPMATAMGLGGTPWSPLKGGLLSGKYRRDHHPEGEGRHLPGQSKHLTEANYAIIDALLSVAAEVGTGAAQVALAWVLGRPAVASPILGVRTLGQFESNLQALDIALSAEQVARLDASSKPPMVFPYGFLPNTLPILQGGTSVNGLRTGRWGQAPASEDERW
jgi:aryl-alcohol dehydrogenase-like predicted oxidoreductase